jgi:hypothetical protein
LVAYTSEHPQNKDEVHTFKAAVIHNFPKNKLQALHEEKKLLQIPTPKSPVYRKCHTLGTRVTMQLFH